MRERLRLDHVRLIPTGIPPHRRSSALPAARRLELLQRAVADEPGLVVDDRELRREGLSYTVDTLAELRSEFPEAALCLLAGSDSLHGLHGWKQWPRLFQLAHVITALRPDVHAGPAPAVQAALNAARVTRPLDLTLRQSGCWLELDLPPLAISSTRIRALLAAGRSIRGLVPDAVLTHLKSQDLEMLTRNE